MRTTIGMAAIATLLLTDPTAIEQRGPAHDTIDTYAGGHPMCQEWSDGCSVCLRHGDGAPACSLPGIACEPGLLVCHVSTKPDRAGDTSNK